jgi:DNA recombination protein Rad52
MDSTTNDRQSEAPRSGVRVTSTARIRLDASEMMHNNSNNNNNKNSSSIGIIGNSGAISAFPSPTKSCSFACPRLEADTAVARDTVEVLESSSFVRNPFDRSILYDHKGQPITVARMLATKPLRAELSTRPGPGNKKILYMSGESITRALNEIFGFDGWNLEVRQVQSAIDPSHDVAKDRWTVAYMAQVRLTHALSGTYREDIGAGDAMDKSLATATANAMKASVTDALKRAARHFGDKLGNSLYQGTFNLNSAPVTLEQALDQHELEQNRARFGGVQPNTGNYNKVIKLEGGRKPECDVVRGETKSEHPSSVKSRAEAVSRYGSSSSTATAATSDGAEMVVTSTSVGGSQLFSYAPVITPASSTILSNDDKCGRNDEDDDEYAADFLFPDMPLTFQTPMTPMVAPNARGDTDQQSATAATATTTAADSVATSSLLGQSWLASSRPQTSSGKRMSLPSIGMEPPAKKVNGNPYSSGM